MMTEKNKINKSGATAANAENGKSEFVFNGHKVVMTRKKMKYIRVRIGEDGILKISAPIRAPIARVTGFLQEKEEWIRKKTEEALRIAEVRKQREAGDGILLWDTKYMIAFERGEKLALTEVGCEMRVTLSPETKESEIEELFEDFYRRILEKEIAARLPIWEEKTGIRCCGVKIRKMGSRWGSCSPQSKKIRVSQSLVCKPRECVDLILVHELGHILYPNHGKEFYRYLDGAYPQWREIKKKLNPKM